MTETEKSLLKMLGTLLGEQIKSAKALEHIAESLSVIAANAAPKAPNYQRPIAEFPDFDWTALGAEVIATDEWGVLQVEWGGYIWQRRAPKNKFHEAIWFSRPEGKDADGKVRYVRLVTFKVFDAEAAETNEKAMAAAGRGKETGNGHALTDDARLTREALKTPSAALGLEWLPVDLRLYRHLVSVFGIDKSVSNDIWRELSKQPDRAIAALDQHVF